MNPEDVLSMRLNFREIPFEMKLPKTEPLAFAALTKEQFDSEIEKGMKSIREGKVYSADEIEAEMRDVKKQFE